MAPVPIIGLGHVADFPQSSGHLRSRQPVHSPSSSNYRHLIGTALVSLKGANNIPPVIRQQLHTAGAVYPPISGTLYPLAGLFGEHFLYAAPTSLTVPTQARDASREMQRPTRPHYGQVWHQHLRPTTRQDSGSAPVVQREFG